MHPTFGQLDEKPFPSSRHGAKDSPRYGIPLHLGSALHAATLGCTPHGSPSGLGHHSPGLVPHGLPPAAGGRGALGSMRAAVGATGVTVRADAAMGGAGLAVSAGAGACADVAAVEFAQAALSAAKLKAHWYLCMTGEPTPAPSSRRTESHEFCVDPSVAGQPLSAPKRPVLR